MSGPSGAANRQSGDAIEASARRLEDCREAARAAREALPLLKEAVSVQLLSVGASDVTFDAILSFLAQHGVAASSKQIDAPHGSIAASILSQANAFDSDLLVMGAFGHWRFQELILGGVTEAVFREASLPVFLSH